MEEGGHVERLYSSAPVLASQVIKPDQSPGHLVPAPVVVAYRHLCVRSTQPVEAITDGNGTMKWFSDEKELSFVAPDEVEGRLRRSPAASPSRVLGPWPLR
jgi:hypothetical protein